MMHGAAVNSSYYLPPLSAVYNSTTSYGNHLGATDLCAYKDTGHHDSQAFYLSHVLGKALIPMYRNDNVVTLKYSELDLNLDLIAADITGGKEIFKVLSLEEGVPIKDVKVEALGGYFYRVRATVAPEYLASVLVTYVAEMKKKDHYFFQLRQNRWVVDSDVRSPDRVSPMEMLQTLKEVGELEFTFEIRKARWSDDDVVVWSSRAPLMVEAARDLVQEYKDFCKQHAVSYDVPVRLLAAFETGALLIASKEYGGPRYDVQAQHRPDGPNTQIKYEKNSMGKDMVASAVSRSIEDTVRAYESYACHPETVEALNKLREIGLVPQDVKKIVKALHAYVQANFPVLMATSSKFSINATAIDAQVVKWLVEWAR